MVDVVSALRHMVGEGAMAKVGFAAIVEPPDPQWAARALCLDAVNPALCHAQLCPLVASSEDALEPHLAVFTLDGTDFVQSGVLPEDNVQGMHYGQALIPLRTALQLGHWYMAADGILLNPFDEAAQLLTKDVIAEILDGDFYTRAPNLGDVEDERFHSFVEPALAGPNALDMAYLEAMREPDEKKRAKKVRKVILEALDVDAPVLTIYQGVVDRPALESVAVDAILGMSDADPAVPVTALPRLIEPGEPREDGSMEWAPTQNEPWIAVATSEAQVRAADGPVSRLPLTTVSLLELMCAVVPVAAFAGIAINPFHEPYLLDRHQLTEILMQYAVDHPAMPRE